MILFVWNNKNFKCISRSRINCFFQLLLSTPSKTAMARKPKPSTAHSNSRQKYLSVRMLVLYNISTKQIETREKMIPLTAKWLQDQKGISIHLLPTNQQVEVWYYNNSNISNTSPSRVNFKIFASKSQTHSRRHFWSIKPVHPSILRS